MRAACAGHVGDEQHFEGIKRGRLVVRSRCGCREFRRRIRGGRLAGIAVRCLLIHYSAPQEFCASRSQLVVFGGGVLQTLVGIAGRVVIPDTGHQIPVRELGKQHFAADGVTAMSAPGFHELGGAWIVDHVQQQSGEWLGSGIGEGIRDVVGRVSGNRVDDIGGVAGCLSRA